MALYQSHEAYQTTRALAHLDLEPEILIQLRPIPDPSEVVVSNLGPVDAVQLELRLIHHQWRIGFEQGFGASTREPEDVAHADNLEPGGEVLLPLSETWRRQEHRYVAPDHLEIMEAYVVYRRPADRKRYAASTLYFSDGEGEWFPESEARAEHEPFTSARIAVRKYLPKFHEFRAKSIRVLHSDPLIRWAPE